MVDALVKQCDVGLGLLRRERTVEDSVDDLSKTVPLVCRHAHQVTDHGDGQREGQPLAQVHHLAAGHRGKVVDQRGDHGLNGGLQLGDAACAEGGGDHPA
ncbi:hypothetical protein GCM10027612_09010 [Microbispora bryophytorum subsp. camponoti]